MEINSLVSWLPFDNSTTEDLLGNTWTAYGSPAVENDKLKLNGSSYLKRTETFAFTGQPFTISCKFSGTSNTTGGVVALWQMYISNSNRFHVSINTNGKMTLWKDSDSTVNIASSASVLDGQEHHFECDFDGSKWYLFLDGKLIGSKVHTCSARTYTLYVGTNYATNRKFTGTIDEFQIYDGVALHDANFTPPTDDNYIQQRIDLLGYADIALDLDTERKITNAALTWRYENPGDADDLIVSSTILTDLPATQSATGTAFYQTQRVKCFDLPNTPEVWMKFDVYFDGSNRWRAYNDNSNGVNGVCSYVNYSGSDFGMWQNSNRIQDFSGVCKTNQLQTVLLHMISGSTTGVIEAWVDGSKIYTYTGDVNHGSDFADLYLQSDGSGTFFSNVIISNIEIGLDEVAALTYTFYLDTKRVLSDSNPAKVWLSFEDNSITDVYGHTVTTYGNPVVIDADTINGKALQLDGSSYLKISDIALGERDFVVDFWVNVDPSQTNGFQYFVISPLIGNSFVTLYTTYASNNSEIVVWLNKTSDLSSPYGQITGANFDSFIGSHIHIQLFYRYNHPGEILGHFRLCINGKMIDTRPYSMTYQCHCERQLFDIFVGANLNDENCLTGTIDNFRIYETTNYTFNLDTQRRVIKAEPYNFDLDTERKLANVFDFYADTERRLVETINAYYTVQHDDKKYKFPLSRIRKGESFAVWWNGAPLYNELVDPSDPRAGIVHLWHNSREWALSDQIIVGEAIPATRDFSVYYQNYQRDFAGPFKLDTEVGEDVWTWYVASASSYIQLPDEFENLPVINIIANDELANYNDIEADEGVPYADYYKAYGGSTPDRRYVAQISFSDEGGDNFVYTASIQWSTNITQTNITSQIYDQNAVEGVIDAFFTTANGGATMQVVDGHNLTEPVMGGLLDYDLSVTSIDDVPLVEGTDWVVGGSSEVSLSPTAVQNNPDGVKVSYKTYSVVDYDEIYGTPQVLDKILPWTVPNG